MDIWGRLEGCMARAEELGHDLRVKCETASECAWSCEVSWTQDPNRKDQKPDVSAVWFAGGGATPEDCLARCLDELEPFLFG